MGILYTFRCDEHGDFRLEQTMATTTRHVWCDACGGFAPKVLGGRLQFTYGKSVFHDGPNGDGNTIREAVAEMHADANRQGLDLQRKY